MGLDYRRRVRTSATGFVNVSKRGVSYSKRVGRATFNSRGGGSIRIAKGLSFRWGKR